MLVDLIYDHSLPWKSRILHVIALIKYLLDPTVLLTKWHQIALYLMMAERKQDFYLELEILEIRDILAILKRVENYIRESHKVNMMWKVVWPILVDLMYNHSLPLKSCILQALPSSSIYLIQLSCSLNDTRILFSFNA